MAWPFVAFLFLVVVASLALLIYLRVSRRPAFRQTAKEVVIREPGKRLLGAPQPVAPEARKDLAFARLSQSAYEKIRPEQKSLDFSGAPRVDTALREAGWVPWPDFPDDGLEQEIAKSHLRLQVWTDRSHSSIAVAFGGTVFTSGKDWRSNFRWFIPHHDDEYTEIVKAFAPAFAQEFLRRKEHPDWAFLQHATIYATGHSLGGGLAQQFAYALPIDPAGPRVTHVFAFDPSPVTGFYSLKKNIRDYNKRNLRIDRVYERGEILAILRSFTNFVYPPSRVNPSIRHVRYNLFWSFNPIAGHSIAELAQKLYEATS